MGTLTNQKVMVVFLVLLSCVDGSAQDGGTGANWPHYGGSDRFWRYSTLDQIRRDNIKQLAPVWAFQTGEVDGGCRPRRSWSTA